MIIRDFQIGDELALREVFLSAVHEIAINDYTAEQINAWAPRSIDCELWVERMRAITPFVVEHEGKVVAYADVQASGYIDHFFVSGPVARKGVGTMLMNHIHDTANHRGTPVLTSDVSKTAQPFFQRFGFSIVEQKFPEMRGVVVPNALMSKVLVADQPR